MKNVVVVLPIYQEKFNKEESLSLSLLRKRLSREYSVCIITHKGLKNTISKNPLLNGYNIKFFDKKYFTYQGYNRLLKTSNFYNQFSDFKYMLIYQTDCLVFKNNLDYWIDKNYDYVGAPWISKTKRKFVFKGVGNGGLSLRKVDTFMIITKKFELYKWKFYIFLRNFIPSIGIILNKLWVSREDQRYHVGSRNEDVFFSFISKQLYPKFKIATIQDALKFSFEKYPEFCFRQNQNLLPFGCHAFHKDLNFWKRFI